MKKTLLISAATICALSAVAQAVETPKFSDNWSIGVQGGVTTPLTNHKFVKSMKPVVGITLNKQVTPTFGVGAEGYASIATSDWRGRTYSTTAFDDSYAGLYGTVDLFNLFGGYNGTVRPFTIDAMIGAGWGHMYIDSRHGLDHNYFATKAGLNFNFNVSDYVTINVSPSVYWDMSDSHTKFTSAAYNAGHATFNLLAGVKYHFGGHRFDIVTPYNQAEVDALNGQVNDLRAALVAEGAATQAALDQAAALALQLNACQNQPVQTDTVTSNQYSTVRYVFYRIGSATITNDQKPNVEQIADYLRDHPNATVIVKGYASKDGNYDFNIKLAQRRAESVKTMLVKTYKIKESRITAEGEGIGNMFDQESWNRVSICTIENNNK